MKSLSKKNIRLDLKSLKLFLRSNVFKKISIYLVLAWLGSTSPVGICGIWEVTQGTLDQNRTLSTYQQVVDHLPLLTSDEVLASDPDHEGTILVAGGLIVVSPTSIQSFKSPEDYIKGIQPEFQYPFVKAESSPAQEDKKLPIRNDLEKIRIALDIIPSHSSFTDLIGSLTYERFVQKLQADLNHSLSLLGAEVSILRPRIEWTAAKADHINQNPPQIVISTQFNNDQQDCMLTFCGGHISKTELSSERQRARFIQSALTGKHFFSAGLGACITKRCQDSLNVQPLAWELASFEGNAKAVPALESIRIDAQLEESAGKFNGIAMRNLMHNGLFAKAVVVPFPDMKWVREQVALVGEEEWTRKYALAISEGVLSYVKRHSNCFE